MITDRTVALVIDVQRWIADLGLAPRSGEMVAVASDQLAQAVRAAGGRVIFVRYLRLDGSDGGPESPFARVIVPTTPQDVLVDKYGIDAFDGTRLPELLASLDPDTVVVCGISTIHAVRRTARTAATSGYQTVVLEPATSCLTLPDHERALAELSAAGIEIVGFDALTWP